MAVGRNDKLLGTHSKKSLTDFYGEKGGGKIWDKFTLHYTPKHASWLDQAEIEIGIFSRQCLGKDRIGDIPVLRMRATAWNRRMNRQRRKINWRFTAQDARRKFRYKSISLIQPEH